MEWIGLDQQKWTHLFQLQLTHSQTIKITKKLLSD